MVPAVGEVDAPARIAIQPNSRYQFWAGSESISSRHRSTPRTGTNGDSGTRNGRGRVRVEYSAGPAPPRTTTANANSVPMLVISSRASSGSSPAIRPTQHADHDRALPGVRNVGWMAAKNGGNSPSRDMAISTRADPSSITSSTDVIPATPAAAIRPSAHASPTCLNASDTPAPRRAGRTAPSRSARPPPRCTGRCRSSSDPMMPIGTSRCGFLASSAWVETASNPMYAKKMMAAPAIIPTGCRPCDADRPPGSRRS